MKRLLLTAVLLILVMPAPAWAAAEEEPAELDAAGLAEEIDVSMLEQQLTDMDQWLAEQDTQLNLSDLWQRLLSGEQEFNWQLIRETLGAVFFGQLRSSASLLGQLLLLSLMAVLLTLLKNSFGGAEIAQIGRWVVYLLLLGLAVMAFMPCLSKAKETVEMLKNMVCALLPLLVPLLASLGGITTVSLLDPALLFALSLLLDLMGSLIFPLICFSAVLNLCGSLSPRISLAKMAGLFKNIAMGVMGIMVSLFIAFLGFSGMAAATTDGLAVKAVKSAAGTFIPIVGRSLADAFDSVLGTALILKNTIGLIGVIGIIIICALPAVYILLQALMFKIAGAVIQPLGEEKLAEAVSGMGNSLIMLFAALAVSGLFAYFAISLTVSLGNTTMMMR